jgi:hypothetical protein
VDAAVAVVVIAGVFGGLAMAFRHDRRRLALVHAAWRDAAGRLGAELGRTPHAGLTARVDGAVVRAAVVDHIGARARFTRVWARARVRPQARLAVGTRRRRLEAVELDAGVPGWTDRPRHATARWSRGDTERWQRVRAAVTAESGAPCHLVSDGYTVELVIGGAVDSPDGLVAAVELVGRIAGDDLGAIEALSALPGASTLPEPALGVRLAPDDVVVEVDAQTSATAITGTAELGATRVRVRSAQELAAVKARWTSPALAAAFTASGAATLVVSLGETRLAWDRLELDLDRIRAGLTIVRAIASALGDAGAPYR